MTGLVVATQNQGKMREIRAILAHLPYEVVSMAEAGVHVDVEETGTTFEENALLKADAILRELLQQAPDAGSHLCVLADDSGLEVDALGGEPGIYSARYGGSGLDDTGRWRLLLQNMQGIPPEKRTARFVCAVALVSAETRLVTKGIVEGTILTEPKGENGFGYDPIFFVTEAGMSAAQLEEADKNRLSHRGRALAQLVKELA